MERADDATGGTLQTWLTWGVEEFGKEKQESLAGGY